MPLVGECVKMWNSCVRCCCVLLVSGDISLRWCHTFFSVSVVTVVVSGVIGSGSVGSRPNFFFSDGRG